MRRGEVYFTNRDGFSIGSEMQGKRPALIVSNDKNNTFSGAVEVVYLTTQEKKDLPTHVRVRSGSAISTVLCEQIDTISKERLGCFLCELTPEEMAMVDVALAISIGIDTPPRINEARPGGTYGQPCRGGKRPLQAAVRGSFGEGAGEAIC